MALLRQRCVTLLEADWSDFSLRSLTQNITQGHVQVQRFATVSGLNDMFPGNGVQWCAIIMSFLLNTYCNAWVVMM